MKGFRTMAAFALTMALASHLEGGEQITVQRVQGDVEVRAGVAETWNHVRAGDILKPDATIRTGKQSTVLIAAAAKRISVPPEVMLDMSDIRELTQEELMLKLTMEKVRASSYQWKDDALKITNTTAPHGAQKDTKASLAEPSPEIGAMQMRGAEVLFKNSFYSTSALKAIDVLRRYPSLARFENRLLVAQSLEKARLKSEALDEYSSLAGDQTLTNEQKDFVQRKVAQLKKR